MHRLNWILILCSGFALGGCGDDSTAPPTQPPVPDAVVLAEPAPEDIGGDNVQLRWTISLAGDFAHYAVIMQRDSGSNDSTLTQIIDPNIVEYLIEGLSPSTDYTFRVDVVSSEDQVGRGNTVTLTTVEYNPFVPATTPDLVMENFERVWESMNIAEYTKLLSNDFQFFFDPEDNLDDYIGGPSWGRVDELASVTAMFSNQSGFDPVTEEPIPPILSIEFEVFVPLDSSWQSPPPGELYVNTVRMRYTVSIKVTYQGTGDTVRVRGENWFYVTIIGEQEGKNLWGIKVWEDRGSFGRNKAEGFSWGRTKAQW